MTKVNSKKKSNQKVGGENKKQGKYTKQARREAREILERGETLGGVFIEMMMLSQNGVPGIGMCAVAMARALAALKSVARSAEVDLDGLYEANLKMYEDLYAKVAEEELRNRNHTKGRA